MCGRSLVICWPDRCPWNLHESALTNALQQLSLLAEQAEGTNATHRPRHGFAGELQSSLQRINQLQQTATRQSNAFQAGSEAVSLSDVMADSQRPAWRSRWACRCAIAC
jgi:flagellar hook-basal body complex protein FliE